MISESVRVLMCRLEFSIEMVFSAAPGLPAKSFQMLYETSILRMRSSGGWPYPRSKPPNPRIMMKWEIAAEMLL